QDDVHSGHATCSFFLDRSKEDAMAQQESGSFRSIRDVMTPNPASVSDKDSVKRAAEIMKREDAGVVPVVDGRKMMGIVTDRDIVVRVIAEGKDCSNAKISDAMSKQVRTVRAG